MDETIADIDAQIEWPEFLSTWIPDVTFAWIEEGLTDLNDFQEVTGLNVTLDTGVELAITGGADAGLFEISDDGTTLKALQEFDHDAPQDDLVPGLLSVELALRDGDGELFDHTRAYVVVRPDDTGGHPFAETGEQIRDALESFWTAVQSGDLAWSDFGDLLETIGLGDQLNELSDVPDADFLAMLLINFWDRIQPEVQALLNGDIGIGDLIELPGALEDLAAILENGFQDQDADGPSNDFLLGAAEGGEIPGGLGCDLFVGQSDNDIVVYDGLREDFEHDELCPGLVAIHKSDSESDLLVGVERVVFNDGDLVFDIESDHVGFVYRMYEACFDRTADEEGLRFWTKILDHLESNEPWVDVKDFMADQFLAAQEFVDRFGSNLSNEDYINAMYENVLERKADKTGFDFWVDGMEQGLGFDDILIAFTECAENVANTTGDLDNGIWVA